MWNRSHIGMAVVILVIPLSVADSVVVNSTGISGFSGQAGLSCTFCHSGGVAPSVTLTGPSTIRVNQTAAFTLTISGGQMTAGGLDVSTNGGTLIATDANTRILFGDVTHNAPFLGDPIVIPFNYQAPAAAGTFKLFAAGNSVNFDGFNTGDLSNTTTMSIDVTCDVQFTAFGQGLAGSGGLVPDLSGTDGTCAGDFQLHITNALGAAPCFLWVGFAQGLSQLFGGDFYINLGAPYIILPIPLFGTPGVPGAGFVDLPGTNVAAFAGLSIFLQATIVDQGAPRDVSLTNGLQMDIGP